jgi:hypothetical protein
VHILIGTPAYDDQVFVPYHNSVLGLIGYFRDRGIQWTSFVKVATIIAHARNQIAQAVLEDKAITHLLFVDADMGLGTQLVHKMLAFDQPVVSCLYPKRRPHYEQLAALLREGASPAEATSAAQSHVGEDALLRVDGEFVRRGDFLQTRAAGTGVMLIKREVFERFAEFPRPLGEGQRSLPASFQPFAPLRMRRPGSGTARTTPLHPLRNLGGELWSCFNETIHPRRAGSATRRTSRTDCAWEGESRADRLARL